MDLENFILPEQFTLVTENEAKFILDHSEKLLKETLDASNLITTRTSAVLTLTTGMMLALVGFGIGRWDKNAQWDILLTAASITGAYLFFIALKLVGNLRPNNYKTIGALPKDFFCDNFFNEEIDKDRLKCFYINEIISYHGRIKTNNVINENRWKAFNQSVKFLVALPFVLGVSYYFSSALF